MDFALKVLNWDADTIVRLQLWDIAGKFMSVCFSVYLSVSVCGRISVYFVGLSVCPDVAVCIKNQVNLYVCLFRIFASECLYVSTSVCQYACMSVVGCCGLASYC